MAESSVEIGESGVGIVASGATCNLSMNWEYSYSSWFFVSVSDSGSASVQVEGMQVGLTLNLENQGGSLKLSLLDCGCYVKDISIKLNGGASWLYQGVFNAFEAQIGSAVENAVTKQLKVGVLDLDKFLQDLPKAIEVDDNASLNVTFVNDLSLRDSSIGFQINGLFVPNSIDTYRNHHLKTSQPSVSCPGPSKMLGISLDEEVFNSAATLYYDAKFMQKIIDKVPDQTLLNTAGWRFIVPQLYRKYPNHDMNLNISLSSPPEIRISPGNIAATAYVDLIVGVLDGDDTIQVACISLVTRGSGSVKIIGNNLAGSVKLNNFSMKLKWSNIGKLHLNLIQPIVWTVIETVVVPNVNSHLSKGFPLPIIHGFTLENAQIVLSDSDVNVCSDVAFTEWTDFSWIKLYQGSSLVRLSGASL